MDLVEDLRAALASRDEILLAYLFGSQARGRTHPRSDVDVAVWLREPYDRASFGPQVQILGVLNAALHRDDVDLVILNEAH